jgi:hypothetical protein
MESMRIANATKNYEAWLSRHTRVIEADLTLKHSQMTAGAFSFLRATFYRWMQLWPEVCGQLATAPAVLAVGDLHIENFGTWRDIEGRLIWGINDLDEAYPLPYTLDLVRLATSMRLAIAAEHLGIDQEKACDAVLKGYREGIEAGGRPFVLAEDHGWLREIALGELRDPVRFWRKMDRLPSIRKEIPISARKALESLMPESGIPYRIAHRIAGLGSLGRPRFVALAAWRGGRVAREAKALLPSACAWACDEKGDHKILYQTVLDRAVRSRDPFVRLRGRWIVRRLAPDCSRVELDSLPRKRDEYKLLQAMGWETANIHLASRNQMQAVRRDLKKRGKGWLCEASAAMMQAMLEDWKDWRKIAGSSL